MSRANVYEKKSTKVEAELPIVLKIFNEILDDYKTTISYLASNLIKCVILPERTFKYEVIYFVCRDKAGTHFIKASDDGSTAITLEKGNVDLSATSYFITRLAVISAFTALNYENKRNIYRTKLWDTVKRLTSNGYTPLGDEWLFVMKGEEFHEKLSKARRDVSIANHANPDVGKALEKLLEKLDEVRECVEKNKCEHGVKPKWNVEASVFVNEKKTIYKTNKYVKVDDDTGAEIGVEIEEYKYGEEKDTIRVVLMNVNALIFYKGALIPVGIGVKIATTYVKSDNGKIFGNTRVIVKDEPVSMSRAYSPYTAIGLFEDEEAEQLFKSMEKLPEILEKTGDPVIESISKIIRGTLIGKREE